MEIEGSVALVTGASRGIGLAFARALLSRGAARVYAGVRRPGDFHEPGVEPLLLDVTNHQHIEAAAVRACDASIVINNAEIMPARNCCAALWTGRVAKWRSTISPHGHCRVRSRPSWPPRQRSACERALRGLVES